MNIWIKTYRFEIENIRVILRHLIASSYAQFNTFSITLQAFQRLSVYTLRVGYTNYLFRAYHTAVDFQFLTNTLVCKFSTKRKLNPHKHNNDRVN